MDIHAISTLLTTQHIGRQLEWNDRIDSTNAALRVRAQNGAPEGLVIGTEEQSAGKGRFNRVWVSNAGENLLFSVLLRPRVPLPQFPLLNFLAAAAVAEAIGHYPSLPVVLRWPNDVYISNKKVCGILSEMGDDYKSVVLGIGVNVNQSEFPAELSRATSLALESNASLDRGRLLHIILKILDEKYAAVHSDGFAPLMQEWRSRCDMFGKEMLVQNGGVTMKGRADAVAEDGALCLATADGMKKVYAGEATLHDSDFLVKAGS